MFVRAFERVNRYRVARFKTDTAGNRVPLIEFKMRIVERIERRVRSTQVGVSSMDYASVISTKKPGRRMTDAFTFGIEEEYFLVDAETKSVVHDVPQAFFDAAKAAADGRISPEFLQPQIEVISSPHTSMADARAELRHLRETVSIVAAEHGLAVLAAGTHPTAVWREAQQTNKERYDVVMDALQMIGQRDMLCGMHVHVALPDPDQPTVEFVCFSISRFSWLSISVDSLTMIVRRSPSCRAR